MVQLSHPYMTTGKTTALTIRQVSLFSNQEVVSLCAVALAAMARSLLPCADCPHPVLRSLWQWTVQGRNIYRHELGGPSKEGAQDPANIMGNF